VRSIQESYLKRRIFFGEESFCGMPFKTSLLTITASAIMRNQLIIPEAGHLGSAGEIQRWQRLGGMWN
jgi:hypothetical protein